MLTFWCDKCRRVGRTFTVLPPTLKLGEMLPALVGWVSMYHYCVAPPALQLGSVLPIFGCFYYGS